MSEAIHDWSAVLHAGYAEEAEQYAVALRLATEAAAACGRGEPFDERLRPIFATLDEIAARDAQLAPAKQRWEQAGRPTDAALRGVMDCIAELIRQLGRELQTIEQAARARREQLAAELDVCNRRRQMQRAYLRKS